MPGVTLGGITRSPTEDGKPTIFVIGERDTISFDTQLEMPRASSTRFLLRPRLREELYVCGDKWGADLPADHTLSGDNVTGSLAFPAGRSTHQPGTIISRSALR